jgi:hypothetical protein
LGEAVWRSRLAVARAYPERVDWLAYVVYGDPRARGYWPEESEGYTVLECTNADEPLRVGKTYTFRASIRTRPPVQYQDRLVKTRELPHDMRALFLAPGLHNDAPTPIEMEPAGRTVYQASVDLSVAKAGDYPLTVQFYQGTERVKTLQVTLKVRGEHS